jgi:TIR domain
MPRIFINYRRDDSAGYAGRIHDSLASTFGSDSVFIDVDDIKPGVDYVSTIEERIAGCDVMLALIGHRWVDSQDASGHRRLDDPADFVRVEIERALARRVRIIPVLIGDASMPGQTDLPPGMSQLATLEAIALSDSRWQYDMSQLTSAIGEPVARAAGRGARRIWAALAALVIATAVWRLAPWDTKPSHDVSGRWVADVRYDFGGTHTEAFVFRVTDGGVAGTASFLGVARGIVDGKVNGATLSFNTRTDENAGSETRQTEHHYTGIVNGDELRLSMETMGGFSPHAPIDFVATRTGPSTTTPR